MKIRSTMLALAMTFAMLLPHAFAYESDAALSASLFATDSNLYRTVTAVNQPSNTPNHKIGEYSVISIKPKAQLSLSQLHKNSYNPAIFDPIDEQTYLQNFNNLVGGSASYLNGRFSAQTGIVEEHSPQLTAQEFFIQGSYAFIKRERFNMQVVAKVATVEQDNDFAYSFENNGQSSMLEGNDTKATWGIVGSYALSPQWAIIGAFTSTAKDIEQNQALGKTDDHAARVGTTYWF